MKVGFYLIDTRTLDSMAGYACAKALAQSVRRTMPRVPVVHFTDDQSPAAEGVDQVLRLPKEPMARLRMKHHASVSGDWLFVDTDVLIQQDVRRVFDRAFDLAVTIRDWPHVKAAPGFTERMPFNMGVVFSRCAAFWDDCYRMLQEKPKDLQRWMGDQEVFCDLIAMGRYRVEDVSGTRYNFPPTPEADPKFQSLERDAAILHFKGPQRKVAMLRRIGALMLPEVGEVVPCA